MNTSGPISLLLSSLLLAGFCFNADYAVFKWSTMQQNQYKLTKAMADTLSHGIVAGWTCANVMLLGQHNLSVGVVQVGMGVVLGSVIDLDHFVEARSLTLEVHKQRMPYFICYGHKLRQQS